VLEAALGVIDREAPESFTLRRVAEELGLGVMTLYGYVASKDELIEGMTEIALAQPEPAPSREDDWESVLGADVKRLYAVCSRHPNLVALVLAQASASPGLFHLRERILGTLLVAGFDGTAALQALGVLTSYALGFGGMRAAAAPIDLPERIRELPEDGFPRLHAVAERYTEHLSDEAFEHGLELLLGGLRAELERS
jgi:AcrR family transcriptional regulator